MPDKRITEEDVVVDVAHRLVRAAGGVGAVVHGEEDACHSLTQEGEHRC